MGYAAIFILEDENVPDHIILGIAGANLHLAKH